MKICMNICLTVLVTVGTGVLAVYLRKYMPVTPVGFNCNDNSIRLPVKKAIGSTLLGAIGTAIVLFVVIFNESVIHCFAKNNRKIVFVLTKRMRVPLSACIIYLYSGLYLFGAFSVLIATMSIKHSARVLRPNFWGLCRPDPTSFNCSKEDPFVEHYRCMQTDKETLNDAYLSFPSGHATYTMYFAVFLVMYGRRRISVCKRHLGRLALEGALLLCACCIGFTRVADNMHRLVDVLCGLCLGGFLAASICSYGNNVVSTFTRDKTIPATQTELIGTVSKNHAVTIDQQY